MAKGIIVRTKKSIRRQDGTYVRFDSNAVVIIDDAGNPKGHARFRARGARVAQYGLHENNFFSTRGGLDMLRISRDDTVMVMAGKDKGKTGKVVRVMP